MIKIVREKDLTKCAELIRKSFMTVAKQFNITQENAPKYVAFAVTHESLKKQFCKEHRTMYAYYNGDDIIGFYSLSIVGNGECELNNLCVLPEFRHEGIGKRLLENSFSEAKKLGCKVMRISIVEENKTLKKWYENFGFVHIDTVKYDFFPFTCGYMNKDLQ